MKKMLLFLLIISLSVTFTGCMGKEVELKDLTVVQGIGVDKKNDELNISIQVFDPAKASGSANELSGNLTKILHSQGKSIYEAIYKSAAQIGGDPFTSQNHIIVLGEDLVKEDIKGLMDYFFRNHETRMNVTIAIAKGEAKEILQSDASEALIPAEDVVKLIQASEEDLIAPKTDVLSVLKSMKEIGGDFYITALKIKEEEEEQEQGSSGSGGKQEKGSGEGESGNQEKKKDVVTDGVGVFKENKLIGYLDEDECKGLLWITGKVSGGVLVVQTEEVGQISTEIIDVVPKIQFSLENDIPVCSVNINCFLSADEIQGNKEENFTLETLDAVEKQIGDSIKKKIEKAINKCVQEYNVDIFRLNDYFRNYNPGLYKQVKDNWHDYIKTIQFRTDISVQITRVGEKVIKRNNQQ